MSKSKYAIEVKNYTKKFGRFIAVDNATFNVSNGSIHGFIGPNGAGKTTTIKAMIGAYYKSAGQIYIEGHKAGSVDAKSVARYIPEKASFPTYMDSMEYLTSMAQLAGLSYKVAFKKANKILHDLGLLDFKFKKPAMFSSGMKKKILVAQAMITNPTVLILDEPAANLDPTTRKELFKMFRNISKQGTSILISSHILSELQGIIDEVTFIFDGKIQYSGKVAKLANENGILMSFFDDESKKTQKFIKKYNFEETISGWKSITKTHKKAINIAQEAIKSDVGMESLWFLERNLSSAYDKLVVKYQKENEILDKKRGKK